MMVRRELSYFRDLIECCSGRLNRTVLVVVVVVVGLPFDLCVAASFAPSDAAFTAPFPVCSSPADAEAFLHGETLD